MTLEIRKQRWYYRLVKSDDSKYDLLSYYPLEKLTKMIITCFMPNYHPTYYDEYKIKKPFVNSENEIMRLYTAFTTYTYLTDFVFSYPKEDRTFHEIILGELDQKLHFDIDMHDNLHLGEDIKDELILAIYKTLDCVCKVKIDIEKDLLLFTSHSDIQKSYHIVIDNYKVKNNKECKYFFELCLKMMNKEEYNQYIDHGVYKSRQSFRMFNSTKNDEYRPKVFNKTFTLFNQEYINKIDTNTGNDKLNYYNILTASLVSLTICCKVLSNLTQVDNRIYDTISLSNEEIEMILIKMRDTLIDSPFKVTNVIGNSIGLQKTKPYFCSLCSRKHQHENPYISVVNGQAYWICRRALGKKSIHLCGVKIEKQEEVEQSNEPVITDVKLNLNLIDNILNPNMQRVRRVSKLEVPKANIKTVKAKLSDYDKMKMEKEATQLLKKILK